MLTGLYKVVSLSVVEFTVRDDIIARRLMKGRVLGIYQ